MNKVEALASAAERDGSVELPVLTQADLCALGAAHQSLICERTWNWWTDLDRDQQAGLTAKSLEILALRGLVVPSAGRIPAVPSPELGLILAARTRPQIVVICQVSGQDAAFEPRFFGITAQQGGLRALVRETLTTDAPSPGGRADLGTILRYTLMTPLSAADAVASWARRRGAVPTADVFGHGETGLLSLDRFEIRPAGDLYDVRCPAGGIPPGRLDPMELRQALTSAFTGAAR